MLSSQGASALAEFCIPRHVCMQGVYSAASAGVSLTAQPYKNLAASARLLFYLLEILTLTVCPWPQGNAAATAAQMKQQIHQLAAAAAAAASAYPAALAQLAAASSGAFSSDFAAASALAAVSQFCPVAHWLPASLTLRP